MKIVAFDTETYYDKDFGGMSVFIKGSPTNRPFCVTISDTEQDHYYDNLEEIRPLLENESVAKVGANIKYDLHMMLNAGIEVKGPIHDVLVMSHLYNEEVTNENGKRLFGLKDLSDHYLGEGSSDLSKQVDECRKELAKYREVPKDEISFKDVADHDPKLMRDYAKEDTRLTLDLFNLLYPKLQERELMTVYEMEMKVLRALVDVERNGIYVDTSYLTGLEAEMNAELAQLEAQMKEIADINHASAQELVAWVVEQGVEWTHTTDTGAPSTDVDALEAVIARDAVPEKVKDLLTFLLEYRQLAKLQETYVHNMLEFTQHDGRIHPSFNQTGTVTGRMSCSNPNFQNIPKKDKRIRAAIVPSEGKRLYFLDYAQQEYRLLAHYAKEFELMNSIRKGHDVHRATAAMLYKKQYDEVTDEERSSGKTLNFALVYGLGLGSIATVFGMDFNEQKYKNFNKVTQRLKLKPWKIQKDVLINTLSDPDEIEAVHYYFSDECKEALAFAKEQKAKYFKHLPMIETFLIRAQTVCKQRGYVKTWTGRRRNFRDPVRDAYKAPNSIIQGGCGDILKDRLPAVMQYIKDNDLPIKVCNLVHDEISLEASPDCEDHIRVIKGILEDVDFAVPMTVDMSYTDTNWGEKIECT